MTYCPKCAKNILKPTKLEAQLPALLCLQCQGSLVNLLSYRNWTESDSYQLPDSFKPLPVAPEDHKKALQCPKCQHLMSKFKIEAETDNRVDVCLSCDEAWLDQGEWTLLKQLELQDKLASITTEPWQIRVKKEQVQQLVKTDLEQELGVEDYQKAIEISRWLAEHPKRNSLLKIIK